MSTDAVEEEPSNNETRPPEGEPKLRGVDASHAWAAVWVPHGGWVQTDPMYLVFPGAALFLITLAFNVLGDALRDALDPRARERREDGVPGMK